MYLLFNHYLILSLNILTLIGGFYMGKYFVGKPKLFGNGKVWDFADALERAQDGDTIELETGFNPEGEDVNHLKITKSIAIEGGVDPQTGDLTNNLGSIFVSNGANVTLKNLILTDRIESNLINVSGGSNVIAENVFLDSDNKYPPLFVKESRFELHKGTVNNKQNYAGSFQTNSLIVLDDVTFSNSVEIIDTEFALNHVDLTHSVEGPGMYVIDSRGSINESNIIGGFTGSDSIYSSLYITDSIVDIADSWLSSLFIFGNSDVKGNNLLILENTSTFDTSSLDLSNSKIGGLEEYTKGRIDFFAGGSGQVKLSEVAFGNLTSPSIRVERKVRFDYSNLYQLVFDYPLTDVDELLHTQEEPIIEFDTDMDMELVGDEPAYDELQKMVGLTSVKKKVDEILATAKLNKQKKEAGMETSVTTLHSLFLGNPGTGKTTVARLYGKILYENGLISSDTFNEVSRANLVGEHVGQTAILTKQALEDSLGGVLFIDEAYTLYKEESGNDFGKEAIDEILAFMENHRDDIVIIFAGYTNEMNDFLRSNPGLRSRIPHDFVFEDFSADELAELGVIELRSKDYIVDSDDYAKLVREKLHISRDNSNGRWVRNLNEELLNKQSFRLSTLSNPTPDMLREITLEDMNSIVSISDDDEESQESTESAYDQLMELTGLETVKKQIDGFIAMAQINKSREEQGLSVSGSSLHSLFLGNPGTGKTTVARLLGQIMCDKKITEKSTFKEVSRADLVGKYIGHTAQLTKRVLEDALGGVLFIDEAYTLFNGKDDSRDFGKEAIDEILAFMENNRQNIVIIFAGYDKEMHEFLTSNPGLKSRIPNVFNFDDYSVDELVHLGLNELNKGEYIINEDSYAKLVANNHETDYDNSNGRWIRNLNEELIKNQSVRVSQSGDFSKENLTTITDDDIAEAYVN